MAKLLNPISMQAMAKTNVKSILFEQDKMDDLISVLKNGGLILYPTDTIWGIGCDATNPVAIRRVFKLKKRSLSAPFVILVDSVEMLKKYVRHVHPRIETLLAYHTRPLTLIFEEPINLPEVLVSSDNRIAVRIAQDDFCKELIAAFDAPLVAATANLNEEPIPANFGEISSEIISGVDYVAKLKRHEKSTGELAVAVKVNDEGEMEFIRE